jgi:hypothetical protein
MTLGLFNPLTLASSSEGAGVIFFAIIFTKARIRNGYGFSVALLEYGSAGIGPGIPCTSVRIGFFQKFKNWCVESAGFEAPDTIQSRE